MKKKKLLKKRKEAKNVSSKTQQVLEDISERSGIRVVDIVTICCQNTLLDGLLHPHQCVSCGRENWRDKWGVVFKVFEIEEGGSCAFCESEEDWETKEIDDFVEGL